MKHGLLKILSAALCAVTVACPVDAPAKTTARTTTASGRTAIPTRSANPYLGAIVEDAATGQVLFEDKADAAGYPASVVKLMDMCVILDRVENGQLSLSNSVEITREASDVGGTQVWLKEKEVFTVDELLYALMLRSANDAAVALAIGVAGSQAGFVDLMNRKASELGLSRTHFTSVHGLPPTGGRAPDVSTPRDLALLARSLLKHETILRYTSTRARVFRAGSPHHIDMENHNHLLGAYPGCDGLKTGFFTQGGFSLVATAQRGGRRVVAVLLGCADRKARDKKAAELLSKGFAALPAYLRMPGKYTFVISATTSRAVAVRGSDPAMNVDFAE